MATNTRRPNCNFCPPWRDGKAACSAHRESTPRAELRATRKPRLLFRFVGVFLLRFADRQFLALLFQLPPRFTRLEACGRSPAIVLTRFV